MKTALIILAGAVLILIASWCGAYTGPVYASIKPYPAGRVGGIPYRPLVDVWAWNWMNYWYANSEDGVSGQYAWIWDADGNLVPYASTFPSWTPKWVIAWTWSAWRNNANNFKRPLRTDSLNIPWRP